MLEHVIRNPGSEVCRPINKLGCKVRHIRPLFYMPSFSPRAAPATKEAPNIMHNITSLVAPCLRY